MQKIVYIVSSVLLSYNLLASDTSDVRILDYTPVHKDAVMQLICQDPTDYFPKPFSSFSMLLELYKKKSEVMLNDEDMCNKILIDQNSKVVGYLIFCFIKELSNEQLSVIAQKISSHVSLKTENAKDIAIACQKYVKIEGIAIDTDYRKKGYGSLLLQYLYTEAKKNNASYIILQANKDNIALQNLCNSLGYIMQEKPSCYEYKKHIE